MSSQNNADCTIDLLTLVCPVQVSGGDIFVVVVISYHDDSRGRKTVQKGFPMNRSF